MPKAYIVVCYREIRDPEKIKAYAELAPKALKPFGAKVLARGGRVKAFEDGLEERTVVAEFPSFEQAVAGYQSEAYQAAIAALGDGAVRDFRIVEGE